MAVAPTAPIRVTFVCLGNICRSPMAASVCRYVIAETGLSDVVFVDSYGTGDWHVGQDADPRAIAALRRRGYDPSHRARQITVADLDGYDLILGMDQANVSDLRALAGSGAARDRVLLARSFDRAAPSEPEVPDPYYGTDADFDDALDLIEGAVAGLVAHLAARVEASGG